VSNLFVLNDAITTDQSQLRRRVICVAGIVNCLKAESPSKNSFPEKSNSPVPEKILDVVQALLS